MKAKLIFDLPQELEEFEHAQAGVSYVRQLDELDNYLRNKIKYIEMSEELRAIYQEIRDELWSIRNE